VLKRVVDSIEAYRSAQLPLRGAVAQIATASNIVETDVPKTIRNALAEFDNIGEYLDFGITEPADAEAALVELEQLLEGFQRQPLYGEPPTPDAR
jgi:hypothetical protein